MKQEVINKLDEFYENREYSFITLKLLSFWLWMENWTSLEFEEITVNYDHAYNFYIDITNDSEISIEYFIAYLSERIDFDEIYKFSMIYEFLQDDSSNNEVIFLKHKFIISNCQSNDEWLDIDFNNKNNDQNLNNKIQRKIISYFENRYYGFQYSLLANFKKNRKNMRKLKI